MYAPFTDRARKVAQLANQEAQRFNSEYIGTEHILLGLVKEGHGLGITALKNLGVTPDRLPLEVERLIAKGDHTDLPDKLPTTPRARKVIEYAMEEAQSLKRDYVGTEHILLGLLREEEGVAAQLLMNVGVNLDKARAEIQAIYQSSGGEDRGQWMTASPKTVEGPPEKCPKCGGLHVVRVVWNLVYLGGKDQDDVDAGRAIIGSIMRMEGPPWVCLDCSPTWMDVHRLALQDYEWQLAKETAVASSDFGTAVKLRDAQGELRQRWTELVQGLLREHGGNE